VGYYKIIILTLLKCILYLLIVAEKGFYIGERSDFIMGAGKGIIWG
jgi:hypothetical protein